MGHIGDGVISYPFVRIWEFRTRTVFGDDQLLYLGIGEIWRETGVLSMGN